MLDTIPFMLLKVYVMISNQDLDHSTETAVISYKLPAFSSDRGCISVLVLLASKQNRTAKLCKESCA